MNKTLTLTALSAASLITAFYLVGTYLSGEPLERRVSRGLTSNHEASADRQIELQPVADGFEKPTDIQFIPGTSGLAIVLEKAGTARLWKQQAQGAERNAPELFHLPVVANSELGLLGLAFAPDFPSSGLFYLNYNPRQGPRRTCIAEWKVDSSSQPTSAQEQRVLLEVGQPYSNHDGGGLAFGEDRMLYVALGDGGSQNDPHKNGQNAQSLLGKILRLDPKPSANLPYSIPNDNPFLNQPKFRPEIWAYGLRNPWRFSFTSDGQIITGDVGQDRYEEVDLIRAGDNLGWNVREAGHCLASGDTCSSNGFVDPIFEYNRSSGSCVIGGTIYRGSDLPSLKDKYIFGDCASGRLWALVVPKEPGGSYQVADLLGQWPQLNFVTFARDAQGEVYVADFASGTIYKIQPRALAH